MLIIQISESVIWTDVQWISEQAVTKEQREYHKIP